MQFNYPITVFLKDPKKQTEDMPLSLNLQGEAEVIVEIGENTEKRIEKHIYIITAENPGGYDWEFIKNNYTLPTIQLISDKVGR